MTVRKNIYLLLLTILLAWFGGIGSVWADNPEGVYGNAQEGYNSYVKYRCGDSGFDIQFKLNGTGNWLNTTYGAAGYRTKLQVNGGTVRSLYSSFAYGTVYTVDGIAVSIEASIADATTKAVTIQYNIENTNNYDVTLKIGSWADTQVGSDDRADITRIGHNTIMMTANDGAMYGITAGTDEFTTLWYGYYKDAESNVFNDNGGNYDYGSSTTQSKDSGLAWSWTFNIPAGGQKIIAFGGMASQKGAVSMSGYRYGETPSTPTVSGIEGSPTITYYYNTTDTNTGGAAWSGVTGTTLAPAKYYMYAEIGATSTTEAMTTPTTPFTVSKGIPQASDFAYTAPSNLVYDGTQKTATVTANLTGGKTGMGAVTVKYYSGTTLLDSAPKDAGTYTVKIDVAEGTNYAAATDITSDSWTFTITKATPQASDFAYAPPSDLIYSGTSKTANVTAYLTDGKTGMGTVTVKYYSGTTLLSSAPKNAGTYTVKIDVAEGANYLAATNITDASWTFTISPKPITSNDITVTIAYTTYTGQPQTPVITIKDETRTIVLDNNIDYTISYKGSTLQDVQTYASEIIITGTGNYTGTRQEDFTINPKDINLCSVEGNFANYTGNTINPGSAIMVKDGTTTLNTTDHYTLTVNGGYTYKEPNTYANAITITGKGNYTGTKNVNFSIVTGSAKNLADGKLLVTSNAVYTGTTQVPSASTITVLYDGQALETQYYDITYAPGTTEIGYKDARTYHGAITIAAKAGQADYYGNVTTDYVIQPRPVSQTTITVTDITYDSNPHATKNQLTVKYDDTVIDADNYTVNPASVTDVNIYTLTITGVNNLTGSTTAILKVKKAIDGTFSISSVPTQIYDGTNPVHPIVSVYDGGKLLTANVHYTITYGDNNTEGTNVGSIIVTGIDPYLASHTFHFDIVNEYFTEDDIAYHATSSTTVSVGTKPHVNAIATTSTGITIPASVTHVAIPFQVTGVENGAFTGCSNLRYIDLSSITGYTPSTLERTIAASPFYGVPKQALVYLNSTSIKGENYVYKVGDDDYRCQTFKVYDDISGSQTTFSETNGYQWKFENRHVFTAYTVENTRQLTAGKHYTVCLPYNLLLPSTLKAYTMDGTNTANTLIGFAEVTGTLTAHNPYVIIPSTSGQPLGTTNVEVPEFTAADDDAKTLGAVNASNFTFYGTMRYMDDADATGLYIMQYNHGNPTWMQIEAGSGFNQSNKACVLPMRAYIKSSSTSPAPSMSMSFSNADGTTDIRDVPLDEDDAPIFYDILGRRIQHPGKGIYIRKGQKVVR